MTLATIKKDVLATIKYLVPHSLYSAVSIIFTKCCDPEITVVVSCDGVAPDRYSLVFTVANPISGVTGGSVLALDDDLVLDAVFSADGKTITVAGPVELSFNPFYPFIVTQFYATNQSQKTGVYRLDLVEGVVSCI